MLRLLVCCVIVSVASTRIAQSADASDEVAIRALVAKYLDAREKHDPKAVAGVFTTDADQLVSSGEWRRGREALVRGTLASTEATGGRRSITIQTIRFLAPTVALADGPYEISGQAKGGDRKMWSTFLLTRETDGWRIAAIRNMRPAIPSAAK